MEERIREALKEYERKHGMSQRAHAQLLGVAPMSLSFFLRGQTALGVTMVRAIRAAHPELLNLLIDWLAPDDSEPSEVGPVAAPPRV